MSSKISDERLAELQRAAEAATPGPWQVTDFNEGMCPPRPLWGVITEDFDGCDDSFEVEIHTGGKADAQHIAAFDPPTVLALLAEVAEYRAREAESTWEHSPKIGDGPGQEAMRRLVGPWEAVGDDE